MIIAVIFTRVSSLNAISLKDTFKALQNIKKSAKNDLINDNIRNSENPIISTKNDDLEPSFVNGAGDVLLLEPTKQLLNKVKSEEYQWIEDNLYDIAA